MNFFLLIPDSGIYRSKKLGKEALLYYYTKREEE